MSVLEEGTGTGVRRAASTLNNENDHVEGRADDPVLSTDDKKTNSDKKQRSANSCRGQQPSGMQRRINNNKTADHTWNENNNVIPNEEGIRTTEPENSFAGV
ncbi:hypothetical protein WA026_022692 [Henosepilachna vigintioctopunctata]|uniref:Uncharacterized protein n=1 Tax=Henosepilachna vigintioctopunctata TaxID=420089 RepID=A0AAW1TSZ5_9CUCU